MNIILIGFFIRFLLTIINLFYFPLPGGEYDALKFHNEAVIYKNYLSGFTGSYDYQLGWLYSHFLGVIYFLFGDSIVLGSALSSIAWLLSALILRSTLINLNVKNQQIIIALILYTFVFPISVLYTSFMLREVYMLLFINTIIYLIVKIDLNEKKILMNIFYGLILIFVTSILVFFHRSNIIFIISFIPLIFICYVIYKFKSKLINFNLIIIVILLLSLAIYRDIFEKIFNTIYFYQLGHFDIFDPFRADYYNYEEHSKLEYSFLVFITHVVKNIYNYHFQPTIFKVSNLADLIAMYENIIRLSMIFFVIFKFNKVFDKKYLFFVIFLIMILMETIYAQATVNWGSASRHHVPIIGLIILMLFFPERNK